MTVIYTIIDTRQRGLNIKNDADRPFAMFDDSAGWLQKCIGRYATLEKARAARTAKLRNSNAKTIGDRV